LIEALQQQLAALHPAEQHARQGTGIGP
jgi:hypothetical protein